LGAWQDTFADELADAGADVAAWVPEWRLDAVVARLSARDVAIRTLTREEECVAYAAGRRLGGGRPVVLMQSSGLGNALNALGSLVIPYALGIPIAISMRGTLDEGNPAQVPLGRAVRPLLDSLAIQAFSIRHEHEVAAVTRGVLRMAAEARTTAAMILEPELGGRD
jgi:sulfopyruvate decarboxylase subunit alpha